MIDFYSISYLILYIIAGISRAIYATKEKHMKKRKSLRKTQDKILMIPISIFMMLLPVAHIFTDYFTGFNMNLPEWVKILGLIGFIIAVYLHVITHVALKTNWSAYVEVKPKQKLITEGPYKHVRHPMYTAFLLWAIFQGILLDNSLILVLGTLSFLTLYFLRINDEEKLMLEIFPEYKNYMKRTGRLFPKF
jgi:protein-S-isoprenylcysteine O-methyltransferase Ste14